MASQSAQEQVIYKRPPITEAVIEFRLAAPLAAAELETVRVEFAKDNPAVEKLENIEFQITDTPSPSVNRYTSGYRIHRNDSTEVITITPYVIAFSRLAPYNGWDAFSNNVLALYKDFRSILGYIPISRIGVRYVNRLDIPSSTQGVVLKLDDYIRIHPQYPEDALPALQFFTLQGVFNLVEAAYVATINIAAIPSPLPSHMSILLDIDLGRSSEVPQRESEIRDLLAAMRIEKNRVFELCITDATRELFQL
jgi:uncharacterized protein (TIGR04255 family)